MGRKNPQRTLFLPQSGNREKAVKSTESVTQTCKFGHDKLEYNQVIEQLSTSNPTYKEFALLLSLRAFPFVYIPAET